MPNLPYLSDGDISANLDLNDLVVAVEAALISYSTGVVEQPLRTTIPLASAGSAMFVMPGVLQIGGVKLVTLAPDNVRLGLPTHAATILTVDANTGQAIAVLEGEYITRMRTAAASMVAIRYLAPAAPKKAALLGSGAQAESHLIMMRRIFPELEISVWSSTPANAASFAERHSCHLAASAQAAVRDADIVTTATTAFRPVLKGEWVKGGAHINAVGAPRPIWRELDDAVMKNDVYVDARVSGLAESGDIIGSGCAILGEIGEIAAGAIAADRDRTTIFKSLGLAVEDLAAAQLVLTKLGLIDRKPGASTAPALAS